MSEFNPRTTLNQLTQSENGINRLTAMTGAHQFGAGNNSIRFKFKAKSNYNYCSIKLEGTDLYTMTLMKV